jgi:response regulator RpfG family c-di-GMP phosphodiesterase
MRGLVLGNYRVLEPLGCGGMSIVYKAEQLTLRRAVAIKVPTANGTPDPLRAARFTAEMRAVAQLQHPNIVAAIDAGKCPGSDPDEPPLTYFVMEYVPGLDLEQFVIEHGPLPLAQACDLIHQIASALEKAHERNLVHRDIKPSNIRVTPDGQAKLVDFGLARLWENRQTQHGTVLGTIAFMAPEQAKDAQSVDIRADIYGLGGTLFWCLTGRLPFPAQGTVYEELVRRITQPPPSARTLCPELPADVDTVLARMMAVRPEDRYSAPRHVMRALVPFFKSNLRSFRNPTLTEGAPAQPDAIAPIGQKFRILIVDDQPEIREFCRCALESEDISCDQAATGPDAIEALHANPHDLVMLDVDMPAMTGFEVLQHLRHAPPSAHLKVIMFSGRASPNDLAQAMLNGADDYITKPFSVIQLQARVRASLRLKYAQDRSVLLNQHLLTANRELESGLVARNNDLVLARNALSAALASGVVLRTAETRGHLFRMQRYCHRLAVTAATNREFAPKIDSNFIETLECCAPVHDLGMAGLPDHLLLKPGKLSPEECLVMHTHTVLGAETLQRIAKEHDFADDFFRMAIEVARHHHERYDGQGYPDRLSSGAIPLSARIIRIADVYDALRSRRPYKPALPHAAAAQIMMNQCLGEFDPALLQCFQQCATDFEVILSETPD